MRHYRAGWLFNRTRLLINITNLNNNLSWLKMKQNDTHPPNILLKIYLKKQSQPEILTVVIFILLCTGWRLHWGIKWSPILFSLEWTQATQSINEALWRRRPLTRNQSGDLSVICRVGGTSVMLCLPSTSALTANHKEFILKQSIIEDI